MQLQSFLFGFLLILIFSCTTDSSKEFQILSSEYSLPDSLKTEIDSLIKNGYFQSSELITKFKDSEYNTEVNNYLNRYELWKLDSPHQLDSLEVLLSSRKHSHAHRLEILIEKAHITSELWNVKEAEKLFQQIDSTIIKKKWQCTDLNLLYLLRKIDHLKRRKDDYTASLEACEKILYILDRMENIPTLLQIKCHLEVSDITRLKRNYLNAFAHAYYAMRLWKAGDFYGKIQLEGMIKAASGIAWISSAKYPPGIDLLKEAIHLIQNYPEYQEFYASYHTTLAGLLSDSLKEKSDSLYKRGLSLTPEDNKYRMGYAHYRYGRFLRNKLKYQDAIEQTKLANKIYQSLLPDGRHKLARSFASLSAIYKEKNNLDSSLFYIHQSILTDIEFYNNKDVFSCPNFSQIRDTYKITELVEYKAKVLMELHKSENIPIDYALNHYLLVDTLLQSITYDETISDLHFSEDIHDTYEGILFCISSITDLDQQQKVERIWEIIERYKIRNIIEAKKANARKAFSKSDVKLVIDAQKSINALLLQLDDFNSNKNPNFEKYAGQLYEHQKIIRLNTKDIKNSFGEKPIPMHDLHAQIKDGEQVINYFLGKEHYYIISIINSDSRLNIHELQSKDTSSLNRFLSEISIGKTNTKSLTNDASHLFSVLLEKKLFTASQKVTIIYDNELALFPFDALIDKSNQFLIENYAFSYTNSAYDFQSELNELIERKDQFISAFSFSDSVTVKNPEKFEIDSFPELPYTFLELKELNKLFNNHLIQYTGVKCTYENLLSTFTNSDIVHISSHAKVDKNNRLNNFLVMRQSGAPNELNQVFQYEIANERSEHELVFLAACETGASKNIMGAEPYSLAKAFLDGGTNTVIQSLWQLDDKVSYEITKYFYELYLEGKSPAVALQKAKLALLKKSDGKYKHPYYWGGVIVIK